MIVPDDTVPPEALPEAVLEQGGGRGRLGELARRLEFDRAVFYALAARAWQTLSGPVTIVLIATFFDRKLQGNYYVFGSLLNFQTFFELNLSVVLLNAAGHEWTHLRLGEDGRPAGDAAALDRLAALERFGRRWYSAVALLCWLVVGGIGLWTFRGLPAWGIAAWVATVTASAASLLLLPRTEILRGCHQMEMVNRVGLAQTVTGSLATWASIPAGAGLWSIAASWWAKVTWEAWLVRRRYVAFFEALRGRPAPAVRWSSEIWPLQWRLAVQAVAATAAFTSFTLALNYLRSEEEAGRMGMTWSVLNMLLWAGLAWVQTRVPRLAGYSRRNERAKYDRLFGRVSLLTILAVAAGAVAAWGVVFAMDRMGLKLAGRFVRADAFALLAVGIVSQHAMNCLTTYARTRQREAFFAPNVLYNSLLAAGVWLVAPAYGEFGVAAVYAAAAAGFGLPMWVAVWMRERKEWGEESEVRREK